MNFNPVCVWARACALEVWSKALVQIISRVRSNYGRFFTGRSLKGRLSCWDMCNVSLVPKPPSKTKTESPIAVVFGSKTPKSDHGSCENFYVNCLNNPIYSYFSVSVSFCKAILYKLYNPIVTVFKGQFVQRIGLRKRLQLKLTAKVSFIKVASV